MHDLKVLGPFQPLGSLVCGARRHLGSLVGIVDQVAQLPDHQDVLICGQHIAHTWRWSRIQGLRV